MSNVYQLAQVVNVGDKYMLIAIHKGKLQTAVLNGERQAIKTAQKHIAYINWLRKKDGDKKRQVRL